MSVTGQVCLIRSTTVWLGLWKGMPKSPCSTFQMYRPYWTRIGWSNPYFAARAICVASGSSRSPEANGSPGTARVSRNVISETAKRTKISPSNRPRMYRAIASPAPAAQNRGYCAGRLHESRKSASQESEVMGETAARRRQDGKTASQPVETTPAFPITLSPLRPVIRASEVATDRLTDFVVRGACPHDCPDTCATLVEVRDGRAVGFHGDPDHPFTRGWLCAKVRPYLDRVYSPDRLQYPMRRMGAKGSGEWVRISWEEAIGEIAERWQQIIIERGAAAILPYSFSGTLGLLQGGVASIRLWQRMGACGLERSICGAAAETAVKLTLGGRLAPDARDVRHSRLIVIWGHNPASTSPHFMPFMRDAQRDGAYVVVIDPRRSTTARSADEHLRPRPATDGALALGLMHVLFAEGLHDEAWLRQHSVGWEDLRQRVKEYPPQRVATITGIPAEEIVALARRYGTTKPALLKFADGIQRHGNGGQTCRTLASLPAVVGQIGVRGGGLYYSTSDYVSWQGEALSHRTECPPEPRRINMNRLGAALTGEVSDPPVMSLYVFAANPVSASPNAGLIAEGMRRDDLFTVVHEQFMTDTAQLADIVLPATTQLEQVDLHKPYGQRNLQYNHAAIAPLGEAKSNWDVSRLLARAMGYDEPWLH